MTVAGSAAGSWALGSSWPADAAEVEKMYEMRKSSERGQAEHGWLSSRHTFSFADYYDPRFMGFGDLRVINEDRVTGGAGFPPHPHRDMEILSYVLEGGLEHKDSMGTGSIIKPGELQRMSAGTGVLHSEYNASKNDPLRFLQIWVLPEARGIQPSYEQKAFSVEERTNRMRLLASRDGADGSVTVHQDLRLYGSLLEAGAALTHPVPNGRRAWLQVANGSLSVGEHALMQGDGLAVVGEPELVLRAGAQGAEILLFDLRSSTGPLAG